LLGRAAGRVCCAHDHSFVNGESVPHQRSSPVRSAHPGGSLTVIVAAAHFGVSVVSSVFSVASVAVGRTGR
jgi:hypothetical protein